ncbi:MAG: type IV toxin-antitoxin system AbiEi family antitoxin domain-containing protein [Candidatus Nanohaloarchaea archaeon]
MGELLDWAEKRSMFNLNEAERQLGLERDYLREKLSRSVRRGELKRIERGKYTIHDDPLIYATSIERPSYLSLWSGLRFYNLTTQQPTKAQVMSPVNRSNLENVEFFHTEKMFGFGKENYRGFEVSVAEKERLLLDCLSRRQIPVTELGELVEDIELGKTVEYASRFGKNSVKKRAGYLVEKFRDEKVEELRVEDRNYPLLDLAKPGGGKKDSYWRLEVNADVG